MNKKDIANIRKQFKLNNDLLRIKEIFNVYVQKETGEIYFHVSQPFQLIEQEAQELFLKNFKKVLTGQLDSKLFELKFVQGIENSTQTTLYEGLHAHSTDEWKEYMLSVVEKMYEKNVYSFDTVVTFIRGEYRKPKRRKNYELEEDGSEETYASPFILCSINKIDQPKKTLLFDYVEKTFKSSNDVDPIINLTSPLTGFFFPAFNDNAADVNHILYYTGKVNQPDYQFIEEVLNCEEILTAQDDKAIFEHILKEVVGEKVDAEVISNVYEELDRIIVENEESEEMEESAPPTIDSKDIEKILTVSGVENVSTQIVEHAIKSVLDDEKHEFKANSLVPKTIKIETKVADLTIKPKDLRNMKYIMFEGKRCLLLEIDDDVIVERFKLEEAKL